MGSTAELKGPDLAAGVDVGTLRDGEILLGHAGGEGVALVKRGETCVAVGATCTHYSGPLGEGIVSGDTIRCPWHHARFDLATGAPVGGPGLNPIPCFEVVREGALVRVGKKRETASANAPAKAPARVVVVGGGPAATSLAETMRREGYAGSITIVSEEWVPVDRPNLSKDYLAGTAPEEWMPIRDEAGLAERRIELVKARATAVDLAAKKVAVDGAPSIAFDTLVLATGAAPSRLPIPGADRAHVHVVRTLADSRAIIGVLPSVKRAVVIGGGFIGLEVAGALRARSLDVTVVLRDAVPLEHVLGEALGKMVEAIHVEHGVTFVRDSPTSIDEHHVTLASGKTIDADLVVFGVGVKPRVDLAKRAGLRVDDGIVVDGHLRAAPDVYAVGDVARFPSGKDGALRRVEHFVHAERMGFVAARNILGHAEPFRFAPFFWSQHYDMPVNFVGSGPWDAVEIIGDPAKRDVLAVYRSRGRVVALASVYRDIESLRFEELLERGDEAAVDALLAAAHR